MISSLLPPCRHRAAAQQPGLWQCGSPKMIAPGGLVTQETCVSQCPYVDHEIDPRFSTLSGKMQLLPLRDQGELRSSLQGRGERQLVKPQPGQIAISMLTAPRPQSTVQETIRQLRLAGFSQTVHLFAEPRSNLEELPAGVMVHQNATTLKAWGNWRRSAEFLLANTTEPYLLMCEDDFLLTRDAALGLQHALETVPLEKLGYISLYTPWHNVFGQQLTSGWQKVAVGQQSWGALAYCFSRESLKAVLDMAPQANPEVVLYADVVISGTFAAQQRECYFHVPSLCDHAGKNISTFGHPNLPESDGVDFQPLRRQYQADLTTTLPGKLAVVTCLFAFPGKMVHLGPYQRFTAGLATAKVDLWTVEVAYGDAPFVLSAGERVLQLRCRDVFWQKERALNLLIAQLPPEYDKVAWIDADILFDNPSWGRDLNRALEQYPVVQLFEECHFLNEHDAPATVMVSLASKLGDGNAFQVPGVTTGFAWAARREWLAKHPLLDWDIAGCADLLMASAWTDEWENPLLRNYPVAAFQQLKDWQACHWPNTFGQVGFVQGVVRHIYHGSLAEREYAERTSLLTKHGFNPVQDLQGNTDGLLEFCDPQHPLRLGLGRFFNQQQTPLSRVERRGDVSQPAKWLVDPLCRLAIRLPTIPLAAKRCLATVASHGFAHMLDDMLGSLSVWGNVADALRVVLVVDDDPDCQKVAEAHGAAVVSCRSLTTLGASVKSALYSITQIVIAEEYLCLDADMLIVGSLAPLYRQLEQAPTAKLYFASNDNSPPQHQRTLGADLLTTYGGNWDDLWHFGGEPTQIANYGLVVNDGLMAGSREAFVRLDATLRDMPGAVAWVDARPDIFYRNQFALNAAVARLDCGELLSDTYNVQLHSSAVEFFATAQGPRAMYCGLPASVVHFTGPAKHAHPEWRGHYAKIFKAVPTSA